MIVYVVIVPIIRKHGHEDGEGEAGDVQASKIKFGTHVNAAGVSSTKPNILVNKVTGNVLNVSGMPIAPSLFFVYLSLAVLD